jgi:hypothetical protein
MRPRSLRRAAGGQSRGTDVLIADTAGRLHTQSRADGRAGQDPRVLGKLDPHAPHEVLMVIDGTTGQNAVNQVRQFHAAVGVTGLVVTKLDGTAKGGVVFALAREFGMPIRFVGIGEKAEDLRVFDAEAFVDALLPRAQWSRELARSLPAARAEVDCEGSLLGSPEQAAIAPFAGLCAISIAWDASALQTGAGNSANGAHFESLSWVFQP